MLVGGALGREHPAFVKQGDVSMHEHICIVFAEGKLGLEEVTWSVPKGTKLESLLLPDSVIVTLLFLHKIPQNLFSQWISTRSPHRGQSGFYHSLGCSDWCSKNVPPYSSQKLHWREDPKSTDCRSGGKVRIPLLLYTLGFMVYWCKEGV